MVGGGGGAVVPKVNLQSFWKGRKATRKKKKIFASKWTVPPTCSWMKNWQAEGEKKLLASEWVCGTCGFSVIGTSDSPVIPRPPPPPKKKKKKKKRKKKRRKKKFFVLFKLLFFLLVSQPVWGCIVLVNGAKNKNFSNGFCLWVLKAMWICVKP